MTLPEVQSVNPITELHVHSETIVSCLFKEGAVTRLTQRFT